MLAISSSVSKRTALQLGALIVVLVVLAWVNRWTQDDAFITFRYSRNLVNGLGPVWNRDYVVEGYTNFLWMIFIAGGLWSGIDAEVASYVFGLAAFVASLLLTFNLARRVLADERWALLTTALVGTNYSFLMYATGGLETQLEAALTLAIVSFALAANRDGMLPTRQLPLFSVVMALAVMTRPDSVVPCAIASAFIVHAYYRTVTKQPTASWRSKAMLDAALVALPALLLVGAWLSWKLSFYHELLPNTFRVKVGTHGGIAIVLRGIAYVGWLLLSYWWLPLGLAILVFARKRLVGFLRQAGVLLTFVIVWFAYVIWVGGDIMEFRLLVPVIPLCLIAIVAAVCRLAHTARIAAVTVLLLGSVSHAFAFPSYVRPIGICTIPWLRESADLFRSVGVSIGTDLHQNSDVTIAVSPAGFIPYFSNARSIDMLGLNDPWIARHGVVRSCRVCLGHARLPTYEYLNRARVNLVIGHPQEFSGRCARKDDITKSMVWGERLDYENIPSDAKLIAIPIDRAKDKNVAVLYIHRDAAIEEALAKGLWRVVPPC
jgi:arabinofuranosyltransferase